MLLEDRTVLLVEPTTAGAVAEASAIAPCCATYRDDEDDEIYLPGERSCFNCRYRR